MHIIIATFTEEDKGIYKWRHKMVRYVYPSMEK